MCHREIALCGFTWMILSDADAARESVACCECRVSEVLLEDATSDPDRKGADFGERKLKVVFTGVPKVAMTMDAVFTKSESKIVVLLVDMVEDSDSGKSDEFQANLRTPIRVNISPQDFRNLHRSQDLSS